MLIGQHRRRHQHGYLFTVASSLKGRTHSDLRLAETYIATHQTVHGLCLLHISLHIVGGLQLVGSILIEERCLQLLLQVGVGREGEAQLTAACGIQFDKVAGNILQLALGALLHALPLACA